MKRNALIDTSETRALSLMKNMVRRIFQCDIVAIIRTENVPICLYNLTATINVERVRKLL